MSCPAPLARCRYLLYESIDSLSGHPRLLALGQAEDALADDVALHLGGATVESRRDRVVPLERQLLVPEAGRTGDARGQLPGAPQRLRAEHLEDEELRATSA